MKKFYKRKNKNDEIEILDFDKTTKFEMKKKTKFRFASCCAVVIAIFIFVLSIVTDTNVIAVSTKKVLNGLGIYTEEVKNVEITADDYNNPGSWHIDKKAEWTGSNKARVTFDVNSIMKTGGRYKDVILVLDISGSMSGEKMTKAISDSKELVSTLLSDSHNRVALITFDSTSSVVSTFSNNKDDLLEKLDSINVTGCTNYNAALQNVDVVMEGYKKESNRDVVTLFLTDGYPNEDTPNQVGTYEVLKDKYPYMTINGVQYEMGTDIINEIKQITDSQWVADQSTLNNVLFDASISPVVYEDFIVTDYIQNDYFTISSKDDIKVTMGTVKLEVESGVQKITWNLGKNAYTTGANAKMDINLTLKEEYSQTVEIYYPTNKKESVTYKIPEESEKIVNSTKTPVLKNTFEVIYDTNTPDGCKLDSIPKEKYRVSQNVVKKTDKLSCEGYLFKGWEIDGNDEKDITKVNDDMFLMPPHDVHIRGTWTRQSVFKTMDGTVHEKTTLYKVLQEEATSGGLAREYTGAHQDSMDASGKEKIYHYYASNNTDGEAILNKNNVIFADQCWQMIRTTDTGGVKMIYNGEAVDGKCLSTRPTHIGYSYRETQTLSSSYYYGTSYTYNSTSKTFMLDGEKETVTWNANTWQDLIGKYTCKLSTEDGSCSTLYLVESYYSNTNAYVISLNSNSYYSQFGMLQFNLGDTSPAYVGYMYGDVYSYHTHDEGWILPFTHSYTMYYNTSLGTSYWYADSALYEDGRYSLVKPTQVSSADYYPNLVGKYTFRNSTETYTSSGVFYIAGVSGSTMYYIRLSNNQKPEDYEILIGDTITKNEDGTYTISNKDSTNLATVGLKDWFTNYASYKNMYTCNSKEDTCVRPRYITLSSSISYDYIDVGTEMLLAKSRNGMNLEDTKLVRYDEISKNPDSYSEYKYSCGNTSDVCTESNLRYITSYSPTSYSYLYNYYYGSSVKWNEITKKYELKGEYVGVENYNDLSNNHYFCPTIGEKECDEVGYIYYLYRSITPYYIKLSNGVENITDVLDNMFIKNTKNSTIKSVVDAWYKRYLEDYTKYLEDTIFCNDRSIRNLGGWNPNGGNINTYLYFNGSSVSSDLSCANVTDQFSVNNEKAKLTYPIGLISYPEMKLLGNDNARKGSHYWLASPSHFYANVAFGHHVNSDGSYISTRVYNSRGIRPSVSLISEIEYSDGDGSMEKPYVVLTD